jgi:hypothetical protein
LYTHICNACKAFLLMEAGVSYKQRRDKACYFRELLATDTDTDGGSGIYSAQETESGT